MIAVVTGKGWLKKETAEKQLQGIDEPILYATSYQEMLEHKDEVEIIISTNTVDSDVIAQLPNLKWIFSYSAGVENYPFELLKEKGVRLTNTSGIHKTNIAEQVLGGMIMFSRNLLQAMANKAHSTWDSYYIDELIGKELLIIGAGQIGKEIARKAKAFDMNVYGVRFSESKELPKNFDGMATFDDLLSVLPGKDYICLVVPSTDETFGMIGKEQFKAMDESAVFINVGRGNTVREDDMIKALQAEEIKGAILDVFEKEPLPKESPLWNMPNVIITPHNAGPTPHYAKRAFEMFRNNLARFQNGEDLANQIDLDREY